MKKVYLIMVSLKENNDPNYPSSCFLPLVFDNLKLAKKYCDNAVKHSDFNREFHPVRVDMYLDSAYIPTFSLL